MEQLFRIVVLASAIYTCTCQYYNQGPLVRSDSGESHDRYYREPLQHSSHPPAQIISHKQALNHDGNFKYAFAAENGLSQGEIIAPDGSRNGGYTYVDPNGKKISVKYTAGKEGFRILEGDHIPRAPPHVAPIPHPGYASQPRAQYQDNSDSGGSYARPINFNLGGSAATAYRPHSAPAYTPSAAPSTPPKYSYHLVQRTDDENTVDDKEPQYDDAPGKPHSFGTGYSFEFGG